MFQRCLSPPSSEQSRGTSSWKNWSNYIRQKWAGNRCSELTAMGERGSPDLFILGTDWMHILVGKFPLFVEVGNDGFPWPVQDEPSSLFLLWECSTTSHQALGGYGLVPCKCTSCSVQNLCSATAKQPGCLTWMCHLCSLNLISIAHLVCPV